MKRIAILAYPGCSGAQVLGLHDSMLLANRVASEILGREAVFDVRVVGVAGRSISAAGGVRVGLEKCFRRADLLVVPGFALNGSDLAESLPQLAPQVGFIRDAFRRGVRLAAVCVGSFLLGEAGLLVGRRATTAWMYAPELARRYPASLVDADAVLVDDGGVITTGGFSVAFDLAAHLIRAEGGEALATAFGKFAMLDVRRESQRPYVDEALLSRSTAAFSDAVKQWLKTRLTEPYRLERLARAFAVSPRTLLRRFQAEASESPLSFLQRTRIEAAKVLLASTALSVADITERVGYANVSTFVRFFGRQEGTTPGKYRSHSRAVSAVGQSPPRARLRAS